MVDISKTALHRLWLRSQSLFWPSTCILCGNAGAPGSDLCDNCNADLPVNAPACSVCAEPLAAIDCNPSHLMCGACLMRSPRFDLALCAFRYAYPLDHLVRALKYRNSVAPARVLGEALARRVQLERAHPLPSALIPVPLAQERFRERGYNQAIELTRWLSRRLGVRMRADCVVRQRETAEQAGLSRKDRRKNIRGAFSVVRAVDDTHVAIVDDVITTGSTANELARVLKKSGVKRVEVWAVARAGRA